MFVQGSFSHVHHIKKQAQRNTPRRCRQHFPLGVT